MIEESPHNMELPGTSTKVRAARSAIARASTTAATATTTATTSVAIIAGLRTALTASSMTRHGNKPVRNLLVGLSKNLDQILHNVRVLLVDHGGGNTIMSSTTGTTNAVNIIVDVMREIIVDHMEDVVDIQTTSSHISGDENGTFLRAEELESSFTFALVAITMNSNGGVTLVVQEVFNVVAVALGLNEDQRKTRDSIQKVKESLLLVAFVHADDALANRLGGRTHTTHLQKISSQLLNLSGEGCTEHQGLALRAVRHVLVFNDVTDLRFETHIQHAISLIHHKEADFREGDTSTLEHVVEASGGGDDDVAALLQLTKLRADIRTTIGDAATERRAVAELAGFKMNLLRQFASGRHNQGDRVGLSATATTIGFLRRFGATIRIVFTETGQGREKEGSCLSRSSLGTGHQIASSHNNGKSVLLDGGGNLVTRQVDVAGEDLAELGILELLEVTRGNFTSGDLDRDVIILVKVDTRAHLVSKELEFQSGVGSVPVAGTTTPTVGAASSSAVGGSGASDGTGAGRPRGRTRSRPLHVGATRSPCPSLGGSPGRGD